MKLNTNRWNRLRYTLWAPFYDLATGAFGPLRRRSIELLQPKPGERLLLVGAGTGADLAHIPADVKVTATDLTAAMLARAGRKRADARLAVMDGARMAVRDAAFDTVVLHLILAVMPDPVGCLREVARVVRPAGRIVVFDKFVRGRKAPLALRAVNVLTSALFTDVTRNFESILAQAAAPLHILVDNPVAGGGLFRQILLIREPDASGRGR
jgi:phosphatidylethanolamine/phosphatidyl-N-methylethanolamine N-methyltransferase